MRHLAIVMFAVLACPVQALAEPMSVRCDGKHYNKSQPYFVTFDIESRRLVFEWVESGIIVGEIASTNDERLDLSLNGVGGRVLASFNRKNNRMTWPGLSGGEMWRPSLQHTCIQVTGRSALARFYESDGSETKRRDPVDAFSLTCPAKTVGSYFITMDRATKSIVMELEHFAGVLSGNITSMDDGVIKFTFGRGPSDSHDAEWDERKKSLTFIGIENDPSRPTMVQECNVTKLRSIIEGIDWARAFN